MGIQIEEVGPWLLVDWSKELEAYFRERKIFLGYPWRISDVYSAGQKIRMRRDVVAESYSTHPRSRICEFGAFSYCRSPEIDPSLRMGRYSSVGFNVRIFDREEPSNLFTTHPMAVNGQVRNFLNNEFELELESIAQRVVNSPTSIGNDVRIGDGASLARGIRVGDGAIVGPNAVVTSDVPAFAVVAGNPAEILEFRFDSDDIRARMLSSKWWDYSLAELPFEVGADVESFLEKFEALKLSGSFKPAVYSKIEVGRELLELSQGEGNPSPSSEGDLHFGSTWQEFMKDRVEGREQGIPWYLHDKLKCYEYLDRLGVETITPLRVFSDPDEVELDGLPNSFVIKPSLQSSTKGVMVLDKRGDGVYWDELRNRELGLAEIREEQRGYFHETNAAGKKIIVEPKIVDVDAETYSIPRDFKAYAFRGEVALILEIDRNTKPSSVSWYDGNFNPISDDRVSCNESFVHEVSKSAPEQCREVLDLARRCSKKLPTPFASIDMYLTEDGPCVGEVTLAPGGLYHGKHYILSEDQQRLMGNMWQNALNDLSESGLEH